MRIRLKRGFQKKLILQAKGKTSWKILAKELGINCCYLSIELYNEKRLISDALYKNLCTLAKVDYKSFIEETLPDSWGMSKGGRNSFKKSSLLVSEYSIELAELVGIILGDGNLWEKNGYYYLTIAGNKITDRNYLLYYVKPLMERVFKKNVRTKDDKNANTLYLIIGSKNVLYTLNHYGIPSGNKVKNNVGIPSWILKNREYARVCVRGLIDTDGSVCPITRRTYSYIWFTSKIENLRKSFSEAMEILDIRTSQWSLKKNRSPEIFIGAKDQIAKYLKEVSFKNEKHLAKLSPP